MDNGAGQDSGALVPVRPAGPVPPPSLDELARNPALAAALAPEAARALHAQCVTVLAALLPCLFLQPASSPETPGMPEPAALTPQDAATRFNVPKRWLLAHAHEIPGAVALSRKTIRFDAVRLARWLERHRKAS